MKSKSAIRPFGRSEWFGWSGAESFTCGKAPLVAEFELEGESAIVVADKNGVEVSTYGANGDQITTFQRCREQTQEQARELLTRILETPVASILTRKLSFRKFA